MRRLLATIVLALAAASSVATERERHTPPPRQQQQQSADSNSSSTANPISNAYGGSMGDTRYIALPGGGGGAPSVTCVTWRWYGWGAYGKQDPDLECIRLLAELERLRATPTPPPTALRSLIDAPPERQAAAAETCLPPAKAKSVAQAKRAGRGCEKT